LSPKAASTDGSNGISKAIFFVRLGEVTAAAKGAGSKGKVMQAFTICDIFGLKPKIRKRV
jgi:hypothetical protein